MSSSKMTVISNSKCSSSITSCPHFDLRSSYKIKTHSQRALLISVYGQTWHQYNVLQFFMPYKELQQRDKPKSIHNTSYAFFSNPENKPYIARITNLYRDELGCKRQAMTTYFWI